MKIILTTFLLLLSSCSILEKFNIRMIEADETELKEEVTPDVVQNEVKEAVKEAVNEEVKKEVIASVPHLISEEIINMPTVENIEPIKKVVKNTKKVKKYCRKIDKKFLHWGWGEAKCNSYEWLHVRNSYLGDPLIWLVYGDEKIQKTNPLNTTMIFCTIHGDEITPTKFCFDVIKFLDKQSPETYNDKLVIVAPIINPDSFFKKKPSRANYRGVDVNRNFPTRDWSSKALQLWKSRYRKDKRRFPGLKPLSEQETIFQVNLIKRYRPDKIISVHAPLTILDYDGPVVQKSNSENVKNAGNLLTKMSKEAKGYRIKNYPFFPGSLGNYAGNERGIHTYTLELPDSDNRKHKQYWKLFKGSIHTAIFHDLRKKTTIAEIESEEETVNN